MTDCERALELISAELDGELTDGESAWLEAHLADCPDCRALADDFAAMHRLLPALAPEPPAELKDRVLEAVRAEKTVPFPARKRPPGRWKAWVSVAAAAALVFLGGRAVLPSLGMGGGSSGAPPAAGAELPAVEAAQAPEDAISASSAPESGADQERGKAANAERAAEPYDAALPETEQVAGEAGLTTMMAEPTQAPLDEASALEALLAHLGLTAEDAAGLTSLGLSEDGLSWRFQRTEDGVQITYAVQLDGGEIVREPEG